MKYPKLLKPIFDIAIPWNILEEAPDIREKVRKIGYICRGASIFQTSKLIIYTYGNYDVNEVNFLKRNIEYLITPPYLRKNVFKIEKDLKYVGLLPPLLTPNHGISNDKIKPGDIREGIVIKWDGYYSIVKISDNVYAKIPKPYPIGSKIIVKIEAKTDRENYFRAFKIDKDKLNIYWGLEVELKDIKELFYSKNYDLIILTGKEGLKLHEVYDNLISKLKTSNRILIIFGSPRYGVDNILEIIGLKNYLNKYPFINFIPEQGVETIRTEEAIIAVLSILHTFRILLSINKI